ncbi:hypothetical protein B0T25DRAFT_620390 [Lasiosphaeria hispida]|uniref:HNH nuclease domain-containing protein n=1 Tax=Lasiosphaeria hispida TaxID=260671 RepID=A0AAJ0HWE9_9PEZI|nr:hypothetical protein B0T25DRAFT_620390 [Lasiosphaeria hispida]
MAPRCQIRSALPPPTHPDGGLCTAVCHQDDGALIKLRHPGYPDTKNVLLVFPALDPIIADDSDDGDNVNANNADSADNTNNSNNTKAMFGLHCETARIACAIAANNRWDGFLSTNKATDATPLPLLPDEILPAGSYYFHVPWLGDASSAAAALPYPVVPSFANFQFPHDNLPSLWAAMRIPRHRGDTQPRPSSFDQVVLARDVSCRISQSIFGTESAHLVPRMENSWFNANGMLLYSSRPSIPTAISVDDPRNVLLLRSDLHHLFDQGRFVLVPKEGIWVVHILSGLPEEELAALYHNVCLQPLSGLSVEFLFARFAWTVLAQLSQGIFLQAGVNRQLVTVQGDSVLTKMWSGPDCLVQFTAAKSRSQSPKKRIGTGSENQDGDDDDGEDACTDGDYNDIDGRGRKRWRSSSSPSSVGSSLLESPLVNREEG